MVLPEYSVAGSVIGHWCNTNQIIAVGENPSGH